MNHRSSGERRCSYLVVLETASGSSSELRELAVYLSNLAVSNFEVIVVDASDSEENSRVLRWVSRYVPARPQHRSAFGAVDAVRAAVDLASCDKVIVADAQVRYSEQSLDDLCELLEVHEVVEPQDYFDPMPWWVSPLRRRASTFGFRRLAVRGLRMIELTPSPRDGVRRLASQGAEVFSAVRLFVRRIPPAFSDWLRDLPRRADEDFAVPMKAALFFMLLPSLIGIAVVAGLRVAGSIAGVMAFVSIVLALHGRISTGRVIPWRACFFAPLWILERSVSIYCALLWRVSRTPAMSSATSRSQTERRAAG